MKQTINWEERYPHWNDWRWQMRSRIADAEQLSRWIPVSDRLRQEIEACTARFRMAVTPYYLSLIDPEDPERYFGAVLFGAPLTAARNAVLLFYRIGYAEDGSVEDADFNFVERGEFERTYRRIENA